MTVSENSSSAKEKVKPFQADGLRRVWLAFFHSLEGIGAALKHEAAFRQECFIACLMIPTALLLDIPVSEKVLL
ncbi:MAG: diacylglycerol kinase, partial [Puniceicoccales bacterium]